MGTQRFLEVWAPGSRARMLPVSRNSLLLGILGAGLLLRLVLALVVFPGQGFSPDLHTFGAWAQSLAAQGPGAFYTAAGAGAGAYPPGYLYVLWAVGSLARLAASTLGIAQGDVLVALIKVPAVLADVGVAALLYRLTSRWMGAGAGLVAAALYLFIPVTWYDSALWGQVDAIDTLVMMAAIVLLVEGWSEAATVAAIVAVLVKPQALVCLVVIVPILIRRHLLAVGSGPVPRPGGLFAKQGPIRLLTSALAALVVGVLLLLPFDIWRLAPTELAGVPVVGDVAGLVGLMRSLGSQYSVLTADAYNVWALIGPHPLAQGGAGPGSWTPDSMSILGVPAVVVGGVLLGAVALLVGGGLLLRDGRLPIVLGFTLMAFAFFAVPTRVHERYLVPFFAPAAILASGALLRAAVYVLTGLLSTINLQAVLAGGAGPGRVRGTFRGPGGGGGVIQGPGGAGRPRFIGGPGGPVAGGGPGARGGPGGLQVSGIHLPLSDLARAPVVATTVSVAVTVIFVGLLVAWIAVLTSRVAIVSDA